MLEKEACVAFTWLDRNEMIANPEKFHALLVKKDRTDTTGHSISIQGKFIESEASVKLLGVFSIFRRQKVTYIIIIFTKKSQGVISAT